MTGLDHSVYLRNMHKPPEGVSEEINLSTGSIFTRGAWVGLGVQEPTNSILKSPSTGHMIMITLTLQSSGHGQQAEEILAGEPPRAASNSFR